MNTKTLVVSALTAMYAAADAASEEQATDNVARTLWTACRDISEGMFGVPGMVHHNKIMAGGAVPLTLAEWLSC